MSAKKSLLKEDGSVSTYLNDQFYDRLVAISDNWRQPGQPLPQSQHYEAVTLLNAECRLLDDDRLEDWLDLFVEDCVYWVPGDVPPQDPRLAITWEINDRRRLEDKVARLRTGFAYSQLPPTRSRHCLSNVETWAAGRDEVRARANLTIHTYRRGEHRTIACMVGYVLQQHGDGNWRIEIKQVNLLDADQSQGNISFML